MLGVVEVSVVGEIVDTRPFYRAGNLGVAGVFVGERGFEGVQLTFGFFLYLIEVDLGGVVKTSADFRESSLSIIFRTSSLVKSS